MEAVRIGLSRAKAECSSRKLASRSGNVIGVVLGFIPIRAVFLQYRGALDP